MEVIQERTDSNVSRALDWLADTKEGSEALRQVAEVGEQIRKQSPVKLSNNELKYVMERLWAQRSETGWDEEKHFDIQPTTEASDQMRSIKLPIGLATKLRVRNLGFVIKAAIPQPGF
jgi:hypothetical protein